MSETRADLPSSVTIYDHLAVEEIILQNKEYLHQLKDKFIALQYYKEAKDIPFKAVYIQQQEKLNGLLDRIKEHPLSLEDKAIYDIFKLLDANILKAIKNYLANKTDSKKLVITKNELIKILVSNHETIEKIFKYAGFIIPNYLQNVDQFLSALEACRAKIVSNINKPHASIIEKIEILEQQLDSTLAQLQDFERQAQAYKYICDAMAALILTKHCSGMWIGWFSSAQRTIHELRGLFTGAISSTTCDSLPDDLDDFFKEFIKLKILPEKLLTHFNTLFLKDPSIRQKFREFKWSTFGIYIEITVNLFDAKKLFDFNEAEIDKEKNPHHKFYLALLFTLQAIEKGENPILVMDKFRKFIDKIKPNLLAEVDKAVHYSENSLFPIFNETVEDAKKADAARKVKESEKLSSVAVAAKEEKEMVTDHDKEVKQGEKPSEKLPTISETAKFRAVGSLPDERKDAESKQEKNAVRISTI